LANKKRVVEPLCQKYPQNLNLNCGINYHLRYNTKETNYPPCFTWERHKPTERKPADLFWNVFYSHIFTQIIKMSLWSSQFLNHLVDGVVVGDPWCPKQYEEGQTCSSQNCYGSFFHSLEPSAYIYRAPWLNIFSESPTGSIAFFCVILEA
jgi:hypothetical protein